MAASDPVVSHRKVVMGSNRTFGLVFTVIFALIALLPAIHDAPVRLWALAVASAFATAALLAPRLLYPLNRTWFALGLLLHYVVNPLVMAVLFYGAILPMGLLLRALDKDLLRLKRDTPADSYWIVRDPPGPAPGSMSKQF